MFAQNEASHWYFGQNSGLRFMQDGTVLPLSDGQLNTEEGCSSISDVDGNLLFYTDGRTVWDRNHVIMPNGSYAAGTGLWGDISSTQSAIIIPKPGSDALFYIFTVDEPHHENAAVYPQAFSGNYTDPGSGNVPDTDDGSNRGFNYSVLDLSLTGSNGSIGNITEKNLHLVTYNSMDGEEVKCKCSEKITAVKDEQQNVYWVITHFVNRFYAFKIDDNGVNPNPVVSTVGSLQQLNGYRRNAIGYLKASPDGTKLAIAHQQNGTATGQASYSSGSIELFDFDISTGVVSNFIPIMPNVQGYGVEFSPSSERLYATYRIGTTPTMELAQFDITAVNPQNTKQIIFDGTNHLYALQLAPNNKIYCATGFQNSLGVLHNPDALGIQCDYVPVGQILAPGRTVQLGLPPFITSFFNASIIINDTCIGSSTQFELYSNQSVVSVLWNFGDGSSSTDISPIHTYSSPGQYTVTVQIQSSEGSVTRSKSITIFHVPVANPVDPIFLCATANESYDLSQNNAQILGNQPSSTFGVRYYNNLQDALHHLNDLGNQIEFTENSTLFVKVFNLQNPLCHDIIELAFYVSLKPDLLVADDFIVCEASPYTGQYLFDLTLKIPEILGDLSPSEFEVLFFDSPENALLGQNPIANQFLNTAPIQDVYARVSYTDNPECFEVTSFKLKVLKTPELIAVSNLEACVSNGTTIPYEVDLSLKLSEILNGQSSNEFTVTFYTSEVDLFTNQNPLPLNYSVQQNQHTIFFSIQNNSDSSCFKYSSFQIVLYTEPEIVMNSSYVLCENQSIEINAPVGFDYYMWSTGDSTSTVLLNEPGLYVLTVGINYGTITCFASISIEVIISEIPIIQELHISDWSLNNNSVWAEVTGAGNYVYSLDGVTFQNSCSFTNLQPGEYTMHVKDENGCGLVQQDFYLLMYMSFFTPNGDGLMICGICMPVIKSLKFL